MKDVCIDIVVGLLAAVVKCYDILSLPFYAMLNPPWAIQDRMHKKRTETVASSDGITYKSVDEVHPLQKMMLEKNLDTLAKIFNYACNKFSDKIALGTREILSEVDEQQPNGKVFKKLEMGDYQWLTFSEVLNMARQFGNGLRHWNFAPKKNIMIFSETRQEYFVSVMGAFQQNCTVCTLYATLGEESLIHGINETEVSVIICSPDLFPKLEAVLPQCPRVTHIIYFHDPVKAIDTSKLTTVTSLSFDDVLAEGEQTEYIDCPPTSDDIAIIMYTSGSTGTPKGVMLSHKNLTTSMRQIAPAMSVKPDDIYLAYLPLAHAMELLGESMMLLWGVPMGYSTPLTMTDVSSKIKRGSKGDASVLQPTLMASVPLILDRIYKAATQKTASKGPFVEKLTKFFVDYRLKWARQGWQTPLCNNLVFKSSRALLGGKMRVVACGGAPLAADTHDLLRGIFCVNVSMAYGLTETCAVGTMMDNESDYSTGTSGLPLLDTYIKLVNWEEGGYTIADKPNPRGEIIIGGDQVTMGYYKMSETTQQSFYDLDGQRWFRTGDVGEIDEFGVLKVIDRKKDLLKLQMGEYISLGKVEATLKLCDYVDNVCVTGDSSKNNVVAVVSMSEKTLSKIALKLDKINPSTDDKDIQKEVLQQLHSIGKKCKLSRFELPTACHLTTEQWTPDSKLVTATMKLKRVNIEKRYKEQIENMYKS